MIAATKYILSPTSYAHISKNDVKQYKSSTHWLPACSVHVFFSYSGGFAWTSETWHLHVWVKKASQLLEGFRRKYNSSVDAVVFLNNTVSAGLSTPVCKIGRGWIYQERLPPQGRHAPWLETSFLLKLQNSGIVCKTTFYFIFLI